MAGGSGREQLSNVVRALTALLLAVAALCGLAHPAQAQPALAQTTSTHIATELVAERSVAAPGQTIQLAVSMKPDKGWHG